MSRQSIFHWKNGWCFSRQPGGDVAFWNSEKGVLATLIDRDSWLSIITSVSSRGETAEQFQAAGIFHGASEE